MLATRLINLIWYVSQCIMHTSKAKYIIEPNNLKLCETCHASWYCMNTFIMPIFYPIVRMLSMLILSLFDYAPRYDNPWKQWCAMKGIMIHIDRWILVYSKAYNDVCSLPCASPMYLDLTHDIAYSCMRICSWLILTLVLLWHCYLYYKLFIVMLGSLQFIIVLSICLLWCCR